MKIFLPGYGFENYVRALTALGAEVQFTYSDDCAALLLAGGGDVHPRFYGQEVRGSTMIDEARDEREIAAIRRFADEERPILGICRGAQVINVALGGTLHQDIPGHSRVEGQDRIHGSRTDDEALTALYGTRFPVNSAHHQAIDRLGDGLRAVQWADDGTVEAFRHETLPILGVQWHPERLREPTDGWRLLAWWLTSLETAV